MPRETHPFVELVSKDPRYPIEAYLFVQSSLTYAHDVLKLGVSESEAALDDPDEPVERHISGQQLCEAIRKYALEQYGLMAKVVLNNWKLCETGDFGNIVFNLIEIECMKKSEHDRREDFDDVFDFEQAFQQQFQISLPE